MAEGSSEGTPRTGDYHDNTLFNGALYADDGCSATPVLAGDVHAIMCNMYLLWCIRAV